MKAAILTVGTEILFGQIVNTNATFISKRLNDMGIDVMYHYTVGDNANRLESLLHDIMKECDLIITTGGLGPTQDDLTKDIVCKVAGDELVIHQPSLNKIKEFFKATGREMTENNIKQAYIPSKAKVLFNEYGSAPGFAVEVDNKIIMCMPGPPREMEPMFINYGEDYLKKFTDEAIYYEFIRTIGIGESLLETKLLDLIDGQTDPTIATYVKEGEAYLRVTSKRKTVDEAKVAVDNMIEKIKNVIGEYIYCVGNMNLSEVVVDLLKRKGLKLSSAESCTGGLFADSIISIAGTSSVFDRALVTYSNIAKMHELGVKAETLDKYGAVSQETAIEMVNGLYETSGSDICVSVTGIAGPDGGTAEKPVGLVYTALKFGDHIVCKENRFRNAGRNSIRKRSVLTMLEMIYKTIGEKYEK